MTAAELADLVLTHRFSWTREVELHDGLETVFRDAGHQVSREHHLPAGGRIDFVIDEAVGVEVKVRTSAAVVLSQLRRYAMHVDDLLLVTTRHDHATALPATVGGKPLVVVVVRSAAW